MSAYTGVWVIFFIYAGIRYSTIRNSVTRPYLTGCWSLLKFMTWKVVISRSNKINFICPRSTLLQSWNDYIGTSWKRSLLEKKVEYFGLTLLPPPPPPPPPIIFTSISQRFAMINAPMNKHCKVGWEEGRAGQGNVYVPMYDLRQ
jgi:hypothetical protein